MGRPEDYGQTINAVIWSQVGASLFFLCLRLYCKFKKRSGLWWDDHVLVASWVTLMIASALTTWNVSLGFGKHVYQINPVNFPQIGLNGNVISTISITSAVWSKTSFAMTLLRIEEKGWTRNLIWGAIISMNVLMGLNAMAAWVQCTPIEKYWLPQTPGRCWSPKVAAYYGVFAAGYSALMDILLAMLPWKLIWGLQMKMKEKIGVGIAMTTRTNGSRFGGGLTRTNTVTVTTSTTRKGSIRRKWDKLADDRSDKSILGVESEPGFGKIVRTNEIVVQYDTRSDVEGHDGSYEMDQMDRMNRMV
ncbi:hypothetical protein CNYM01_01151 [Colletotrichum nymphaeae SA-01]|uniref:Rhodopsin domain-containing protein n=1 Tax=Colletotrichum nymphaeae SA-01 TaxID=1460502 RepID=A0A135TZ43_9PEZI|nr:hypothetical protein CNYM01_01151 [Colletotrichum nymphaeae SA-01]